MGSGSASKSRVTPGNRPPAEYLTRPRPARGAGLTMFFVNGAALATWLSLIPAVQQKLDLNASELGLALLGVAGGRTVVTLAAIVCCVILPLLPMAPTLPVLTITLVLFGAALGTMDVAMN